MSFNTAIFYDVENLLKGYNFSQQLAAKLSLEEIVDAVKKTGKLGQIAVQRAYANWSDSRLAIMRGEINELGIDPVQVFGFSRDQKKNAADIQLAIEAIDLAHIRPAIEVFVIVSGDGGFSSLAKKLHEYGKTVIGCAYRNTTNKIFQAVCDDFVWINDPDEEERQNKILTTIPPSNSVVSDPRNQNLVSKVRKAKPTDDALTKTKEILNWYANNPACRPDLTRSGIHLSVVQESVRYLIPNFLPIKYGFPKFAEYLQYACKDTPLAVIRQPPSNVLILLRSAIRPKAPYEVLSDLDERNIHSIEVYRSILETGQPVLRFPRPSEVYMVAEWLIQNPIKQSELGVAIEAVTNGLNGIISTEAVKFSLLSFASANIFTRDGENIPLSEQKLSLREDMDDISRIFIALESVAKQKLSSQISDIKEEILRQLVGLNT